MSHDMAALVMSWFAGLPVLLQKLLLLLSVPLTAPFEAGTLLHWPFLLSASAVGLFVYGFGPRARRFARQYFSRQVWWHPSARADYLYYLINGAFFPVFFAPFLVVSATVATLVGGQVASAENPAAGDVHWGVITVFSVVTFIAYDLGRFLGHFVQHRSDFLWEFHKVHHSAEVLTPLTSFRVHPVDLLLMSVTPGLLTGIIGGLAILWTGGGVTSWQLLGMHGGVAVYHSVSNLRHTHVQVSWGPVPSRWFISPAQHQVHHSIDKKHFHRNMGWALAVWDRLSGTLYIPETEEKIVYGLGDGSEGDYHGVVRMYFLPVVRAITWCVARSRK